ncbi:MAG TPA: hypothetical protein VD973_08825 [Symbiobacteriaceae bacterium]|jgi:hypothetical protein|nr:hypothetical protein [Symbiobacteriaceae bacterium]
MPATSLTNPLLILLGLISAGVVVGTLTGTRLPLIHSDRSALIVLVILGMSMCALGMQTVTYGWTNPFNLVGTILGAIALVLSAAVLLGARVPYIGSDRSAIIVLAAVMAVKIMLAVMRGMVA